MSFFTRNSSHSSLKLFGLMLISSLLFTSDADVSPTKVNIRAISKDLFECVTEESPNANVTWYRSGQSLLQSAVKVDGKLQLLSLSSDVNGLYRCEAYGRKHGQLYVYVASEACCAVWVLFGALLSLNVVGAAAWYIYRCRHFQSLEDVQCSKLQKVISIFKRRKERQHRSVSGNCGSKLD